MLSVYIRLQCFIKSFSEDKFLYLFISSKSFQRTLSSDFVLRKKYLTSKRKNGLQIRVFTRPICINNSFNCVSKLHFSTTVTLFNFKHTHFLTHNDSTLRKWEAMFELMIHRCTTSNFIEEEKQFFKQVVNDVQLEPACRTWKNGHIEKSFNMFSNLHTNGDSELKVKIAQAIQFLVCFTISSKGKALRKDVMEGTYRFYSQNKELCVLIILWYSLFMSEWYEDRYLAEVTLKQILTLQQSLDKFFPALGFIFLKNNDLSNYQRLIETSLQFENEKLSGLLLRALFDHYYKNYYINGCMTVYKCCQDLQIKLSDHQIHKSQALMKSRTDFRRYSKAKKLIPEDVKYKF